MPLKALHLIVLALIGGVAIFAAIASAVGPLGDPDPRMGRIFLGVLAVLGISEWLAWSLALRRALLAPLASRAEAAREELRAGNVPPELRAATIVAAALAEGVGLFGAVAYLVTGYWPTLVAPLASILVLTALIPTLERLEQSIARAFGPA